uniref:Uncharacterized protein n=1 Tax=Arundo donax TaxID=35708 RepID=A0A0A8ZVQ4_ARUDO
MSRQARQYACGVRYSLQFRMA